MAVVFRRPRFKPRRRGIVLSGRTGTIFNQTISATAAGAVTVIKSVGKTVALTAAGAVTIRRSIGKIVAATGSGAVSSRKGVSFTKSATDRASQTYRTWDGLYVCHDDFETRHPQDFVRGRKDNQNVPNARPEPIDTVIGPLLTNISVAAATAATTILGCV
jgi:hypothetical protein